MAHLVVSLFQLVGLFWFPYQLIHTIHNVHDYWGWVLTILSFSFLTTKYKKWMDD
jgi:hypothetical protein